MKRKTRTNSRDTDCVAVVAETLPRLDVSDAEIVAAVAECVGVPSRIADKFSMTISDLLARTKASRAIKSAFFDAEQRRKDALKSRAFALALGDKNTPPDTKMLRWYLKRYE